MAGYPFEKSGYRCVSLQGMYFGLFLAYKIERPVIPGFETDTEFALNSVSDVVVPLNDLTVLLEKEKVEYLRTQKAGSLKRAGISKLEPDELATLIKSKIAANYIYNMVHLDAHKTTKFNLMLELRGSKGPIKLLVALEYKPQESQLRVITLF